jgi:hypothetical protein
MSKSTILTFIAAVLLSLAVGGIVYVKSYSDEQDRIASGVEIREALLFSIQEKAKRDPALYENVENVDLSTLECSQNVCTANGVSANERYVWRSMDERFVRLSIPLSTSS